MTTNQIKTEIQKEKSLFPADYFSLSEPAKIDILSKASAQLKASDFDNEITKN